MTLPLILPPSGTPPFVTAGHAHRLDEFYASVPFRTGHSRQRRLYHGVVPRTVNVSWELSEDQMQAVDSWVESTLQAYTLHFSAQVASTQGTGLLWWDANWVEPYRAEPLDGGRWVVTGSLYLTGEGSVDGPDTGALAAEFSAPVTGTASLTVQKAFGVELLAYVFGKTRLYVEFLAYVESGGELPGAGAIVIDTYAPATLIDYIQVPGAGSISIPGVAPINAFTYPVGAGSVTIDGYAPGLSVGGYATVPAGSVNISTYAPSLLSNFLFAIPETTNSNVLLLLHGDGANGSTTIVDSSPYARVPSGNNATTNSTTQSKFGGASIRRGVSLSYAASSVWNLNAYSGATIEFFARLNTWGSNHTFITLTGPNLSFLTINAQDAYRTFQATAVVWFGDGGVTTSFDIKNTGIVVSANIFYHVAFVKNGNLYSLYIDGVLAVSVTYAGSLFLSTASLALFNTGDYYVDDFQILSYAKYTAAFTPPTSAASATGANVVLTGLAPTLSSNRIISPGVGAITTAGLTPTTVQGSIVAPGVGAIDTVGLDPATIHNFVVTPGPGDVTTLGYSPTLM